MNRYFHSLIIVLVCAAAFAVTAVSQNAKPFVIPELRDWKGGKGSFMPQASTRIVYADPSLAEVARDFARDYQTMFGVSLPVEAGKAAKGDIVMQLKADRRLGTEGYTIDIKTDRVTVSAPEAQGAYWATRTLLQMADQSATRELPQGIITDFPDYPMRGATIDVGRKYFPLAYLEKLVKILSYYKLNALRVHLNDNGFVQFFQNDWNKTYSAFRLECDTYPGLTARDGYYTKQEFIDFQKNAASQYVEIIPEIDVPAHSLAFSKYKPSLGSEEFGMDHLNLFNPETMEFLDALFKEYLEGENPVFVGPRVHIGTDEFGKDYPGFDRKEETIEKFRTLTDHYIRMMEGYGKQAVVWGALSVAPGETPVKADNVILDAWYNGYADPEQMVKDGFTLYTVPDGMVYIVPMAGYYYDYLPIEFLYNKWTPAHVGKVEFPEKDPAIIGGGFAEWNDHVGNGVTIKDIHHRLMPAIQTIAVKTWDGPDVTVPFGEFNRLRHSVKEAPGVNELARVAAPDSSLVCEVAVLQPGQQLDIPEIGFDYTVTFDIDAVKEAPGTVLLSSPNATLYIADPLKGLLGYASDGYLNTFNFAPYPGEKLNIAIEGDNKSTSLFVNGKLVETLDPDTRWFNEGKAKQHFLRTLVFPLQKAGDFKSRISNLKVYNYKVADHK